MKKNNMMRIASVLLVAVLLSTCVISGTFAKYTTSDSASDTARVAKWGVVITASGSLYGENYAGNAPTVETDATKLSVQVSATGTDLVAPGTASESGFDFSINGAPEVKTKVDVTVSAQDIYLAAGKYAVVVPVKVNAVDFAGKVTSGIYTESAGAYTKVASTDTFATDTDYYEIDDVVEIADAYYPVIYANTNANATDAKITEIAAKIAALLETTDDADTTTAGASYTVSKTYDPNTDLATAINLGENNISWAWAFEGQDDGADTILGNLMAGSATVVAVTTTTTADDTLAVLSVDGNNLIQNNSTEIGCLVTSFNITITATQVDNAD